MRGNKEPALSDSALAHLVGYALTQANLALLESYQYAIGKPMKLRPVEFTLLTLLAQNGPVTQKNLATQLRVRAPNLTVIVNRLTQRGLLTSQRNARDGRSVLIGLTPPGVSLQARAIEASRTMEAEALAGLTDLERQTLLKLLHKITPTKDPMP